MNGSRAHDSSRLFVETPEQVSFELPLAGPGSRFGAMIIDGLCIAAIPLACLLALAPLGGVDFLPPFMGALLIALGLALFWGWFFVFESLWDGRTPGKLVFGLRTVRFDGAPLSAREAAIRNLVRIVDLQPGISGALGGFSMLLDRKGRRLGDFAAGTVVVRELKIAFPELPEARATAGDGPVRLNDQAFASLSSFLARKPDLAPDVANGLATRFARRLADLDPVTSAASRDAVDFVEQFHAGEVLRRAAARRSLDAGAPGAVRQLGEKRKRWIELTEHFARRARRTPGDEVGIARDAGLLRELSSDLARARTYGAAPGTILSLERLVAGAHARLYRAQPIRWKRLSEFVAGGFASHVRAARGSMLLATLAFLVPLVLTFAFVRTNPEWGGAVAGEGMVARARAAAANPEFDYRDTWEGAWTGSEALSTFLISNNVQVALLAFAGGMTMGLLTFWVLVSNGLALGAGMAVFANHGVFENLLTFILPHGGIELTAIVLSGGAAFHLGSGFWRPGRLGRGVVMRERARRAVSIVGGVVLMLVLAGVIEGYLSPARLPAPVKWVAGCLAALGLVLYFSARAPSKGAAGLELEVAGDGQLDGSSGGDVKDGDASAA